MKKLIIVAGATGGIGQALCREVTKDNSMLLVMIGRNVDKLAVIKKMMNTNNCLISDLINFQEKIIQIITSKDISEVVFINTIFTIIPICRIEHLSSLDIENSISTNIILSFDLYSKILKVCKEHNLLLSIINFDSGAAYRCIEGWSLYSATKCSVNMFLKSIKFEEPWVNVVTCDPGVVDTNMQQQIREADDNECGSLEQFRNYKLNQQLNSTKEVAEFVYLRYIASWKADSFEEKYKNI